MDNKILKKALNRVCSAADSLTCEDLHHNYAQRHEPWEECPALRDLKEEIALVREYIKEMN